MNTQKELIAYEKITTQQGLDIFKKHIEKEMDLRYAADDVVGRLSFKAARYEGLLETLLMNDPTQVLSDLFLIEVRYEVTEYSNEHEIEGTAIKSCCTKALAELIVQNETNLNRYNNGTKVFKLTTKIYPI
jgi:hypothetical protein